MTSKGDAVSCDVKRGDNTKCSSKNNEQKASKDGSNRGSGHPQKCHSELKTRKEYPKELNPFESDVDISLPSSEKTSTCDFPPEVNSYSKEYSDEHGYSNEGDSISSCCDVKQGDNAKSLSKNNEQKASKDGSIRGSGHPQKCRSDLETKKEYPKELNPFESDISLPSTEKTSNCEEYNDEQEGDTINCDVKQGDNEHSKTPGKPTATQEEECSPYTAMPEAPIASGNTSNHVQPVGSSPSGKEAVVQREESTPNTAVPEVSTSDGETSTHVQPVDSSPFGKEAPVQQEESTPNTNMPEASTSGGDTSSHVKPVNSSPSGKEVLVQQEESTPNTTVPKAAVSSEGRTVIPVMPHESSLWRNSEEQQDIGASSAPTGNVPEEDACVQENQQENEVCVLFLRNQITRGGLSY